MDIPNHRSSHTLPTPRGGGIAVAISWFLGLIYFYVSDSIGSSLFYALLCGMPLTLVGFADDLFSLKAGARFLVQILSAAAGLWFLGGLHTFHLSLFTFHFPLLFSILAFIAIIWSVNLFNFLDGIDGYLGTEVVFIGISLVLLTGDKLGILLAVSVGGFLIWNWPKAKIFMGDVGSTLLGFIVAMLAIYYQNTMQLSIVVLLILASVFWFDATITLLRRIKNREKLSEAHRKHAFQRIVQAGWSHQKTTLYSLGLNGIGLVLAWFANKLPTYQLLFLVIQLVILFFALRFIDRKKPFEYSA
jgi:Fuc2NAc and GlcNAc transferase